MATFDQLSPEQRAIVELVLRQGKTYGELAGMLGMPEERVRELARDALVELAPVSVRGVEEDWRGQLADYVLGQQSGPDATATKGHLRRSEAARSWARSLLDSLEQLYENGSVPAIPEGERRAKRAVQPERTPSSFRSGFLATLGGLGAAVAAFTVFLVLFAVLVWPVGLLTGGDENESSASDEPAAQAGTNAGTERQAGTGQPAGIAIVVGQDGKRQLLVQATALPPSGQNEGYYVWLYNDRGDAKSLGGQVTDEQGNFQAIGGLPADFRDYRFIDVSRQPVAGDADNIKHSGQSVLRGPMPALRKREATGDQPAALGQTVLRPPSG
jgi:hypothetical protein